MSWLYLLINLAAISVPLIFTFHPKIQFYKNWRATLLSLFVTASFFLVWDNIFTELGVWGFNERYLLGIYIFQLPIEEVLFFFCIPYACLFTYHSLKKLVFTEKYKVLTGKFTFFMMAIILLVAFLNFTRLYTFYTFLFLSLCILLADNFLRKNFYLFIKQFLILMIPMVAVNGILTGTGIPEEVVWYNDAENIGIRILTIPVEDFFYGMTFMLLNIFLYEHFLSKKKKILKKEVHSSGYQTG